MNSTTPPSILLLAHAPLAGAFARVVADLGLETGGLITLDIPPNMSREDAVAAGKMLIADVQRDSCLVLVDLGGGCSPGVVAELLAQSRPRRVRVVTGLNLPMLLTVLSHSHLEVDKLAKHAEERGRDGVRLAGG